MWNVDFQLQVILFSFHKSETMLSQCGNSLLTFIPYLIVCPTKKLKWNMGDHAVFILQQLCFPQSREHCILQADGGGYRKWLNG